jgi:hypothetical protein
MPVYPVMIGTVPIITECCIRTENVGRSCPSFKVDHVFARLVILFLM